MWSVINCGNSFTKAFIKILELYLNIKMQKFWFCVVLMSQRGQPALVANCLWHHPAGCSFACPIHCLLLLRCPAAPSGCLLLLGLDPVFSCLLSIYYYYFSTWPVCPPIPVQTCCYLKLMLLAKPKITIALRSWVRTNSSMIWDQYHYPLGHLASDD